MPSRTRSVSTATALPMTGVVARSRVAAYASAMEKYHPEKLSMFTDHWNPRVVARLASAALVVAATVSRSRPGARSTARR